MTIQDRCTERIATAQALAGLPDEQSAAVLARPTMAYPVDR